MFFRVSLSYVQDSTATQNDLRSGTITSQFDYIYRVSNNSEEYEVIKMSNLEQLKANVLDSIRTISKDVADLKLHISTLNDSVVIVKDLLVAEIDQKNQAIADRDTFSFLGIGIEKSAYSSMMWVLVLFPTGALAFFVLQYFRSFNKIIKVEKELIDVRVEIEQRRKNTLERERKLKRELIDAQMGKNYQATDRFSSAIFFSGLSCSYVRSTEAKYDVVIIGLGAVGSATLFQLSKSGKRILGIDRFEPPHRLGSSHGESRITRLAVGERGRLCDFSQAISPNLERNRNAKPEPGLMTTTTGILMDSGTQPWAKHGSEGFLERTISYAKRQDIAHEILDSIQLKSRFPAFQLESSRKGISGI